MSTHNGFLNAVNKLLPAHVYPDVIRRYSELNGLLDKLISPGGFNATIIVGNPGNGKSTPFEKAIRDAEEKCKPPTLAISTTHNTACGLYSFAYDNLDRLLVIDDDRSLLKDKKVVNVLMALCDTRPDGKRMTWNSNNSAMRKAGIPTSFVTHSRVVIINNSIEAAAKVLDALADRANVVLFDPPPNELHVHAIWADPDVWEFIGRNLHLMPYASFRWYFHAGERERNGEDWRAWLMGVWTRDPSLKLFVQIQHDNTLATTAQRVEQFIELGTLGYVPASRATYFRLAKAHPHLVRGRNLPVIAAATDALVNP